MEPTLANQNPPAAPSDGSRLFYCGTAFVMLLVMFIGFRHFYVHGKGYAGFEIMPQIRTMVILHGVTMSGWVLLLLVQSLLIRTRRHRIHMRIGRIAAVFAFFILVSGLVLRVESSRHAPPEMVIWGLTRKEFKCLGFYTILMFAGMVGVGLWYRRRPEIHRPMMLLATLGVLVPAVARIDAVSVLYQGTVWERIFGPSLGTLVLGAAFFFAKWWLTRRVDKWYLIGYGVLAITSIATIPIPKTKAWDQIATVLLR